MAYLIREQWENITSVPHSFTIQYHLGPRSFFFKHLNPYSYNLVTPSLSRGAFWEVATSWRQVSMAEDSPLLSSLVGVIEKHRNFFFLVGRDSLIILT